MILGNYTVLNANPGRGIGNFTNLYSNYKPSKWYQFYFPDMASTAINRKASFPTGTEPSYSFILAIKGGELSSSIGINGSGSVTANMSLGVAIASTMTGSGSMSSEMALISGLSSTMAGSGDVSSDLKGTASLECEILVNEGAATASTIAAAVWDSVAADFDDAGSMGEKLNDAGSAGNPWTDTTTYGAGTKGKLLQDALSTTKFLGLK